MREKPARLVPPQLFVVAAEAQQLLVRALLDDAAVLEHDQAVHTRDRGQAVRDRDHRFAFHQAEELLLDCELDLAVERRRGFVEHQDGRVFQDDARQRHALALAAGELDAALAYVGLVARAALPVLQTDDEFVRLRLARRRLDLRIARAGSAVADVRGDRAVQERSVLRHHADRGAQALLRHRAYVLPVDADAAPFQSVETEQQVDQRRFARARAAHQAHALAGADREVQAVENPRAVASAVVETHVLEADLSARHLELARARPIAARVRYGDRLHTLLHHADALEDSRHLPAHPAGHV